MLRILRRRGLILAADCPRERRQLAAEGTAVFVSPADTTEEVIDTAALKTAQSAPTQSSTRTSYTTPRGATDRTEPRVQLDFSEFVPRHHLRTRTPTLADHPRTVKEATDLSGAAARAGRLGTE